MVVPVGNLLLYVFGDEIIFALCIVVWFKPHTFNEKIEIIPRLGGGISYFCSADSLNPGNIVALISRIWQVSGENQLSFNLAFHCLLTKWTQKRYRHINLLIYSFHNIFSVSLQCICSALSVSSCCLIHKDIHCKCFQNMRIPLAGD